MNLQVQPQMSHSVRAPNSRHYGDGSRKPAASGLCRFLAALATLDPTPRLPRAEAATIGSTAMRSILAAIAVLLCVSVSAAEIPSAASGAYVAPDRSAVWCCRAPVRITSTWICCASRTRRPDVFAHAGFTPGRKVPRLVRRYAIFAFSGPDQGAGSVALDQFTGPRFWSVARLIRPRSQTAADTKRFG